MRKNKTILIVDDDPDIRIYLRKILEGMGHEVFAAENPKEAEKIISTQYPHMVLLDINLDNENGLNFVAQIRMIDPYRKIKIVIISSTTNKKAIEVSQKIGTDGYLVKPINNNILLTTMKKLIPEMDLKTVCHIKEIDTLMMVKCFGQLHKISETSAILRSKIKFTEKIKLSLKGNFLKKYELERAQFVVNKPSKDVVPGVYDTEIQLIGLKESDLKEIRKLNTKKT